MLLLAQLGSGVQNSWITLAGALTATAVYGMTEPRILPWLQSGAVSAEKVEDLPVLKKMPFWALGMGLVAAMWAVLAVVETVRPW